MFGLTRAWRLLTLLSLAALSYTVLAPKLRGGGVAKADTGDDTSATGDGARWPGWPVAPVAVLLDCRRWRKVRGHLSEGYLLYCRHISLNKGQSLLRPLLCLYEGVLCKLTALVTLLEVAVAGLHRGTLTVVIDTVARAPTLLDAPPTWHRTMGPFRPKRPAALCGVARWAGGRGREYERERQ